MNTRKKSLFAAAQDFAATNQPFGVNEVLEAMHEPLTATYVANRLYDLSTGKFPMLRRVTRSTVPLKEAQYINAKVKPTKTKKIPPGLSKEMFHALYGCFGVPEVVRGGRYLYDKQAANLVRKTVAVYISHQKIRSHRELINFLKWVAEKHSRYGQHAVTTQSLKIGIIHALQSHDYPPEAIAGNLVEVFSDWPSKTNGREAYELRANAYKLRQSLTK